MALLKQLLTFNSFLPKTILYVVVIMANIACQPVPGSYAPVVNGWEQATSKQDYHTVAKGETLYAIAWYYGYDYKDIARYNGLISPYAIKVGDKIYFSAQNRAKKVVKLRKNAMVSGHDMRQMPERIKNVHTVQRKPDVSAVNERWRWPTKGHIIKRFQEKGNANKGIDIAGRLSQPVVASLDGKVVYSGNGLVGYGNLIIIKHSDNYLSAYAYNAKNLVKEGMPVKRGQKIATMGKASSGSSQLHFEIRKNGRPVNPKNYLVKQAA